MANKVFIVTRLIKSTLQASMEVRMGVFGDEASAQAFVTATADELRTIVEFNVSAAGQPIGGMTLGSAMQGLGIGAIQHKVEAVEVTEGDKLVQPVRSNLILPPGMAS